MNDDSNYDTIHSSLTAVRCFDNSLVGKQPVAWKEYCAEHWLKELEESMDRCTGRRDITEILLKTELTHHTINCYTNTLEMNRLKKMKDNIYSNIFLSNLRLLHLYLVA